MAAARLPPPQVMRRHLVRLLRRARQLKPVRLLRLLYPGSARCHRFQGEDPSLVWWLSLVNQAGLSVVIRIGVLVIFRARQDKVPGSMRWLAVSLVMVGTSWGQAVPAGQPSSAVQSAPAPVVSSPEASGGTIT